MLVDTEPLLDYAEEVAAVDALIREVLARAARRQHSQLALNCITERTVDKLLEKRSALMYFAAAAPTPSTARLLSA